MSFSNVLAVRDSSCARREQLIALLDLGGYRVARVGSWVVAQQGVVGEPQATACTFAAESPVGMSRDFGLDDLGRRAASETLGFARGDFTFLHIDPNGVGHAVASVAGVVPVYYHVDGTRVAIATRLRELVRYALDDPELDVPSVSLHLSMWTFPENRSFIRGVRVLPPGHQLCVGGRIRVSRYWDAESVPVSRPTRRAFRAESERIRVTFVKRLAGLLPESGNLLTVSGGVDSSIVAAVATRELGRNIHRLTYVHPSSAAARREARYVASVDQWAGDLLGRAWELRLSPTALVEQCRVAPAFLTPIVSPLLSALPSLSKEVIIRVHAGGEFADELFGSRVVFDDWMTSLSPRDLLARPSALPLAIRFARGLHTTRALSRRAALPLSCGLCSLEVMPPELIAAHQAEVRAWQTQLAGTRRGALALRLSRAHALTASYWEALTPLGVVPCFPFFGREILELALSIHPLQNASFAGKRVLRRAFTGAVPAMNLSRRDKGNYGGSTSQCAWAEAIPNEVAPGVRQDWVDAPPTTVSPGAALHLQGLLNIVRALRNERLCREHLRKA